MAGWSKQLRDQALQIWQPGAPRELTQEDARQIAENLVGFFHLLLEWDEAERRSGRVTSEGRSKGSLEQVNGRPSSG